MKKPISDNRAIVAAKVTAALRHLELAVKALEAASKIDIETAGNSIEKHTSHAQARIVHLQSELEEVASATEEALDDRWTFGRVEA